MNTTTTSGLWLATALLAVFTLTGAAHASSTHTSTSQAPIAAAAEALVATGVPGVSVYSAHPGGQSVVLTRGYADVETHRRLTPADRFRIGSVTKTFVATLVLELAHERRLSLDDSIEQHLPGLVPNGRAITLRQLLSHTSGLQDYFSNKRVVAPYSRNHRTHVWPA